MEDRARRMGGVLAWDGKALVAVLMRLTDLQLRTEAKSSDKLRCKYIIHCVP